MEHKKSFEHQPTPSPKSKSAKVSSSLCKLMTVTQWQWSLENRAYSHKLFCARKRAKKLGGGSKFVRRGNSNNQEPQGEDNQDGRKIGFGNVQI